MHITLQFMLYTFLVAVAFDIFIIYKAGKHYSISAYVIRGSKQYPLVVLAFGVLLGHLFWSMDSFDHLPKEELVRKCTEVLEKAE